LARNVKLTRRWWKRFLFMQSSSPTISASTAKLVDIPVVNEVAKA